MPKRRIVPSTSTKPFLRSVWTEGTADPAEFPFTIPAFSQGINLTFDAKVTLFVGENGSGKSTLMEALAVVAASIPKAEIVTTAISCRRRRRFLPGRCDCRGLRK